MPVYVKDPLNPNEPKIDVIELKHREPTKELEPFLIDEYLKQDLWSMKEAVLLLAGYDLKTDCTLNDNKFSPTGIGRVFYLDGLSSHQLNDNGLPDSLNDECFTAYLKLIEHTRHYDIHAEKKHPQDWIKWAIDKGLSPYWLGYTKNITEWFYNHILKKDVWHELEIKALLNADSSIYDLIRAAIVAKTLIPICTVQISEDGASVYGFKATDIIHWAKLKGYAIPDELKDFNTTSQAVEDVGAVVKAAKPDNEKEFNLKQEALRRWMISKGLEPKVDMSIKLKHYPEHKHYTKTKIYAELCSFDNAFFIAEATFNDFWQIQKLLKFK